MRRFRPALALCVLALVRCKDSTGSGGGGCTSTTAVTVGSDFFSPSCAAVSQTATVTWTWSVAAAHNITFEDNQDNSQSPQTGGAHTRTFGTPGTYRYRCSIHSFSFDSGMIGRVVVQ